VQGASPPAGGTGGSPESLPFFCTSNLELRQILAEEQNQGQQRHKGQQLPDKGPPSKVVQGQALQPSTSYWPFALAVALSILLLGVITGPVVLAVGAVLTAVAVIAWGLERR
jgi:hypothetical protein